MTIKELLKDLETGEEITVLNKPFTYLGRAEIKLDSGNNLYWMYGSDDAVVAVSPEDENLILFESIENDVEPEEDMILFQGKEYEFSYEDAGLVSEVIGDTPIEEEDRFSFSDYAGEGGRLMRLIVNENTGDKSAYFGTVIAEDDIMPAD